MQSKRGELIPVAEVVSRLGGPVAAIREASPQALHHFTRFDQVNQLVSASEAAPEYVRGQAHTNGIESFWSMLKRAHKGTFHKLSAKHLHRYVSEFAGRHNIRSMGTLDQMRFVVLSMDGAQLRYKDLVS